MYARGYLFQIFSLRGWWGVFDTKFSIIYRRRQDADKSSKVCRRLQLSMFHLPPPTTNFQSQQKTYPYPTHTTSHQILAPVMKFITSLLCAVATIVVCLGDATIGDSDLKQDHPALAMAVDALIASGKSSSFMSKCPERLDTEHAEM